MITDGVVTTGGGFSYIYPTPSWQEKAVQNYFDIVLNSPGTIPYEDQEEVQNIKKWHSVYPPYPNPAYNKKGRGYPDISVAGLNYLVVTNMTFFALSGTSASCPAFSAMIALLNAARVSEGKSTLGWLNPALYATDSSNICMNIDSGDNRCYGFENKDQCCAEGFYGAKGTYF